MLHITERMNEYQLQFLEDAITIRRNVIAVNKLNTHGLKSECCSIDNGEVYEYYKHIVIIHKEKYTVTRVHAKQENLTRLFDMLANLDASEALKRWLEKESFEDWQVEKFERGYYEEFYER